MNPIDEARRTERTARLRRDRMRSRRQRVVALAAVAVFAVAGTALALRPAPTSHAPSPAPGATPVTVAAAVTQEPTADTTKSAEPTTAPSLPATPAAEPTKSAPAIKPLKPAPGVKTIVVDKSEQRVTLYKANGAGVDTFRCSSGVMYPRIGKYKVYGRRKQSWSLYDNTTFFYFTMFVKSDKGNNIGFHSIPQTPSGKLVGKVGKPVSHGCVRLEKPKAKLVYTWAANGTRVVVKK